MMMLHTDSIKSGGHCPPDNCWEAFQIGPFNFIFLLEQEQAQSCITFAQELARVAAALASSECSNAAKGLAVHAGLAVNWGRELK